MSEQYTPDEDDARARYVATREHDTSATEAEAEWARITAQMKQTAARDGYNQGYRDRANERDYNHAYPENPNA